MSEKKSSSKSKSKSKRNEAALLLELLKRVLPKAAPDPAMAERIYYAVEEELKASSRVNAFEQFCQRVELPDLDAKTIAEVQQQLDAAFGDGDVTVIPDEEKKAIAVEVSLPDGTQLNTSIPVRPLGPDDGGDQDVVLKFISFPVSLPGDPELIWALAKRENMNHEEAGIALTKVQEDFWASKPGQKLLKDRVDRTFAEFIARVPAGMLGDVGLKRHYKLPEALKVLRAGQVGPVKKS